MKKLFVITVIVFMAGLLLSAELLAGTETTLKKEFKAERGEKIEIDLGTGGDIIIQGWSKERIEAEVTIKGRNRDNIEVDFDRQRSGLKITSEYKQRRRNNRTDMRIFLRVPEEFDVKFETNGGDVDIRKIRGSFTGRTMGGDITFKELSGTARITTMGGDIEVEDCELDGRVKTMGGDVDIRELKGNLKGITMGGEVNYHNIKRSDNDADEVSVTTLGGDLDLDFEDQDVKARTFGGDIDVSRAKKVNVSTFGGDINVDEALVGASVNTMGGDITIRFANEYVQARTMGGDIDIKGVDGWVKATTMGGDINVTMIGDPEKGKRDVELKSMGGDIELYVPEGLSMEFDIEIAYTKGSRRNYKIVSDFDMKIEETEKWKSHWGQKRKYIYGTGEVKGGEHTIKIRTTNGNVYVKKGK